MRRTYAVLGGRCPRVIILFSSESVSCLRWGSTPRGGGGGWHEAMVLVCLTLAAPIGLSPLHIPIHCGSEPGGLSKPLVATAHNQTVGGLTRVPSSEAWTAQSEVLKQGAPQQPRMHKSNNASHSLQNNPNKHQ